MYLCVRLQRLKLQFILIMPCLNDCILRFPTNKTYFRRFTKCLGEFIVRPMPVASSSKPQIFADTLVCFSTSSRIFLYCFQPCSSSSLCNVIDSAINFWLVPRSALINLLYHLRNSRAHTPLLTKDTISPRGSPGKSDAQSLPASSEVFSIMIILFII